MSDSPTPDTWRDVLVRLLWIVIILALGIVIGGASVWWAWKDIFPA